MAAFTTTLHASGLPVPMPEFLSHEQLVKWNADQIAAAESKKTAAREQAAIQFYTGKPFDSSSESYLFKYRSYDPEFSRWTSIDPSGFPDGANNQHYLPIPSYQVDWVGLAAKTVINNLSDALEHWSSNEAGTVPASNLVDEEIKSYGSFGTRGTELTDLWKTLLPGVSRSESSGTINRPGTTWGVDGPLTPPKTVGSVDLIFPSYFLDWSAGSWSPEGSGYKRTITAAGILKMSYNDAFVFTFDPNDPFKTFLTDVIPRWYTGAGTAFDISGSFTASFGTQALQYE